MERAVLLLKETGLKKKNHTIWQNKTTMTESDFQIGFIKSVLGNSFCRGSGTNNGAVSTYAKGRFAPWP